MSEAGAQQRADLLDTALRAIEPVGPREYHLDPQVCADARSQVASLCAKFPPPGHPAEL